jgi:hypothetical protein
MVAFLKFLLGIIIQELGEAHGRGEVSELDLVDIDIELQKAAKWGPRKGA